MSSLSIRKLPKEIEKALREESRARNTTKTEIVLKALEERFHLGDQERRRKRLADFFGRMSRNDYARFKEATRDFSRIDEDLWK